MSTTFRPATIAQLPIIGQAYERAPITPNDHHELIRVSTYWGMFYRQIIGPSTYSLRQHFNIERVAYEPYADAEEMLEDLYRGHYSVSTLHTAHPLWTPQENEEFRIWHDIDGHYQYRLGFSFEDEVKLYNAVASRLSEPFRVVLHCESIAQLARAYTFGEYGVQKVGDFLHLTEGECGPSAFAPANT